MTGGELVSATGGLPAYLTSHWAWQKVREMPGRPGSCDPFAALGVAGREQSYSQALAWLLGEPTCAAFAAAWLDTVLTPEAAPPGWVGRPLTDLDGSAVDKGALAYESVATETALPNNARIDLVAHYGTGEGQRVVLAVENKIHAGESPGQLDVYAEALQCQYDAEDALIVLVFLTPAGRTPSSLSSASVDDERFQVRVASWARLASLLETHPPGDQKPGRHTDLRPLDTALTHAIRIGRPHKNGQLDRIKTI